MMEVPGFSELRLVGRGGLGDVYSARRSGSDELVALKVLRDVSDASVVWRRVRREVVAAGALAGHPNVVAVSGVVDAGGVPVVVMEFVGGGSLADRIDVSGPVPAAAVLAVGVQVASALSVAHRLGIVHRDVKPQNLLLDDQGAVKVCDFGIAKSISGVLTGSQTAAVSLRYAAPEEFDDSASVGPAADVFSLGVSLVHLLTGRAPTLTDRELYSSGRTGWIGRGGGWEPELEALLVSMVATDPATRPSMPDVAQRLGALCRTAGVSHNSVRWQPTWRHRARRVLTRRSVQRGMAAVLVVGLFVAGYVVARNPDVARVVPGALPAAEPWLCNDLPKFEEFRDVAIEPGTGRLLVTNGCKLLSLTPSSDEPATVRAGSTDTTPPSAPACVYAATCTLDTPTGIATDRFGNTYIVDSGNNRVMAFDAAGQLQAQAGGGVNADLCGTTNGLRLDDPYWAAVDDRDTDNVQVYIADNGNNRVVRWNINDNTVDTVLDGAADQCGALTPTTVDGKTMKIGPVSEVGPSGLAVGPDGALYVADSGNHRLLKVVDGELSVVATRDCAQDPCFTGVINDIAVDRDFIYVVNEYQIVRVPVGGGSSRRIAGTGLPGSTGDTRSRDGVLATTVPMMESSGLAVAEDGTVYFTEGYELRKIGLGGVVETVAENSQGGEIGDGPDPKAALLVTPLGLAVSTDSVYVAEAGGNRVRVIDRTSGEVATVVGTGTGDPIRDSDGGRVLSGPGPEFNVAQPSALALGTGDGILYIADTGNNRVIAYDTDTQTATVVDISGPTVPTLDQPGGLTFDQQHGTLYIADTGNNRVIAYDTDTQTASVVDISGPTVPTLDQPGGLTFDQQHGTLYIADTGNNRVIAYDTDTQTASVVTQTASVVNIGVGPGIGLAVDPETGVLNIVGGEAVGVLTWNREDGASGSVPVPASRYWRSIAFAAGVDGPVLFGVSTCTGEIQQFDFRKQGLYPFAGRPYNRCT